MKLDELQNKLFDMLCMFDSICTQHGITYFLDSGTALGYVPEGIEKGWSLDVLMPDYSLEGIGEVAAYILSALIGVALLVIIFKLVSIPLKGNKNSYGS